MTTTDVTSTNEVVRLDALPEPGQLFEVRHRQWVVTDVSGGALSPANDGGQHLVGLSSLDEDSMGEEIQVVWQVEAGAQVLEKAGLPSITGWDSDDRLEAFLDAVRWGGRYQSGSLFSAIAFPERDHHRRLPARSVGTRCRDGPCQSPHRGRRRFGQNDRGGAGHPGAACPPSRQDRVRRLPCRSNGRPRCRRNSASSFGSSTPSTSSTSAVNVVFT